MKKIWSSDAWWLTLHFYFTAFPERNSSLLWLIIIHLYPAKKMGNNEKRSERSRSLKHEYVYTSVHNMNLTIHCTHKALYTLSIIQDPVFLMTNVSKYSFCLDTYPVLPKGKWFAKILPDKMVIWKNCDLVVSCEPFLLYTCRIVVIHKLVRLIISQLISRGKTCRK